ncbi:MAG: N-acetylmuramoyl-L-alanine amidase, partial [Acutalibacteraceae bacterium]
MSSKKVFIGAGHGGSDPGAVANGIKEKDLNLKIALACRDELQRYDVEVLMSRTTDKDDTLNDECRRCNNYNPDLAIDIHNNAGGGDGAEVYYHVGGGTSKTLAQNVLDEIVKLGQNSRGIKTKVNPDGTDWLGFIRMTNCPAVLVECVFIDNKTDLQIVNTAEKQKAMGVAIAKGILKTFGINTKPAACPTNIKTPT